MGEFLKNCRKEKGLTLEQLSDLFLENYLTVKPNGISSWETGKTIPEINNLNFLASYYGVSIDDILDGRKYADIDFNSKYRLDNPDYDNLLDYEETIEQAITIRKRVKELIFKTLAGQNTRIDNSELSYLLTHYYVFQNDLTVYSFLWKLKVWHKEGLSNDDAWWKVQKLIRPVDSITLSFQKISDELFQDESIDRFMDVSEDFEKDMLLATIQRLDPIYKDLSKTSSEELERYREQTGKDYDKEEIIKETIRYLIKNGACINDDYLGYSCSDGPLKGGRVIDTLEAAHDYLDKPIVVMIDKGFEKEFYYVENTERNRLFSRYKNTIINPLVELGYSYDEAYELVSNNPGIPDEVYLRKAKSKNIDANRDIKLVKANVASELSQMDKDWQKYKEEWYNVEQMHFSNKCLFEEDLRNGIKKNTQFKMKWVGGRSAPEVREYVYSINEKKTLFEFNKGRDKTRTEELLKSLDSKDLNTIRTDYFQKKGVSNE